MYWDRLSRKSSQYVLYGSILTLNTQSCDCNNIEEIGMMAAHINQIDVPSIVFAHRDFARWLLDSVTTSHFIPVMDDLLNTVELENPIHIQVADGSCMQATHRGVVELHFMSDQGIQVNLQLMHVQFVPGLQTWLFSIESFVSNGCCSVLYSNENIKVHFPSQLIITIQVPHLPPGTYIARTTADLTSDNVEENGFGTYIYDQYWVNEVYNQLQPNGETYTHHIAPMAVLDDLQNSGGVDRPIWQPTETNEENFQSNKSHMNVDLEHQIFGQREISSLRMAASNAEVWDDRTMTFGGDSWCGHCNIAISPRTGLLKKLTRFTKKPLENLFVDCVVRKLFLCFVLLITLYYLITISISS
jgi:hypothetical protein